jgi:hypothetical protein
MRFGISSMVLQVGQPDQQDQLEKMGQLDQQDQQDQLEKMGQLDQQDQQDQQGLPDTPGRLG